MRKLLVLSFIILLSGCGVKVGTTTVARADHSAATFQTAFAQTDFQQRKGLMHVKQMPTDVGMLFIFDKPQPLKFWMRNTLIPLDMLFFDADKKLTYIVENAKPLDETPVGPNADSMYVLEINGGQAKAQHIQVGDRLSYQIQ